MIERCGDPRMDCRDARCGARLRWKHAGDATRADAIPQADAPAGQSSDARWDAYWRSHGVSSAPPRNFLEPPKSARPVRWADLTRGAISDRVAAQWILGMLRRGEGDGWAVRHLREDIVAADVLGSPGLSGDDQFIARLRRAGVVAIDESNRQPRSSRLRWWRFRSRIS